MENIKKFKSLYIATLKEVAKLSTCGYKHVGAILVDSGRIISTGYNGTAPGQPHCNSCTPAHMIAYYGITNHHDFAERYEVHAEMNCLAYALRNHTDISKASMLITLAPCCNCAKLIVACGIKYVYYMEPYARSDDGIQYLTENNVTVKQLIED